MRCHAGGRCGSECGFGRSGVVRALLALFVVFVPAAAFAQASVSLPELEVVAPSPLQGGRIDRDKVPAMVQTLAADDFVRAVSPNITDTLVQRIPGIAVSDPNGNGAQQEIRYRGFAASPLQGTPQGLAVYLGGVRINEAFGDTVNWDLIPTNAIERADVWTNNPVFGLNALGGAISLQMKNGFTYNGFESEGLAGSFGRTSGSIQYGAQKDNASVYVAAQGVHDSGWRDRSPAELARLYADLGWKNDVTELHLIALGARTDLGAAAATPVEMLARNWASIYTNPQTTKNETGLLALNGTTALSDTWSLQGNTYIRGFSQRHVDGNDGDFERCSNAADPQFRNHLCLQDDGFPRPDPVTAAFRNQFAILDQNNNPIPCLPGPGNTCAGVPYGTIDRTGTDAVTVGGSLQVTSTARLLDHGNHFVLGGSVDHSRIGFDATSQLGYIFSDLTVAPNLSIPGNGAFIHTLANIGYAPVNLAARNTYYGLYASDTFDITEQLAATVGGRLNVARITTADEIGNSPDLNASPTYTRFNPLAGLTYKVAPGLSVYGGYSESNRAPTPLELGCSNPAKPCLLEHFLVSDPPLRQVVGHTYEAGLRGNVPVADGKIDWKIGLYRTDSFNDIITLGSIIAGRGSFQNVDATRRQGVEAGAQYRSGAWLLYANYSFLDATYRFTGDVASPNNPSADENGNVHVTPGKHIPGQPAHQLKLGADYAVTPEWKIGADVLAVSSSWFTGDDANQNVKLPGYWIANLHTTYQINKDVQVFGMVKNLFDRKYLLSGTYFSPEGVTNAGLPFALTDQRTEVPGQPLAVYAGIRVKL